MKKLTGTILSAILASMMLASFVSPVFASTNQQVVFQDRAGTGTFFPTGGGSTPFGFWIWCQTTVNSNAYGNDCTGSVYFYELGIIAGVEGEFTGTPTSFTITADSIAGSGLVSCTFTHSGAITAGTTNSASVSCSSPSGTGSDSAVAIKFTA